MMLTRLLSACRDPIWLYRLLLVFTVTLILAPLPLGSNRMTAAMLLAVVLALLLLMVLMVWRAQPELSFVVPPALRWANWLALMVLGWALLQTLPIWPISVQHPLWPMTAKLLARQGYDGTVAGAIALDPATALVSVVRLASYIAAFWIAYLLGRDATRARFMLKALIAAALAYASYGLVVEAFDLGVVLWFPKQAYTENLTATFVNRNSYATYAGLGLLCALAYVFQRWRSLARQCAGKEFWRLFLPRFVGRELVFALVPLTVLAALVLTESRAGFLAAMLGILALGVALALNRRARWQQAMVLVVAALGVAALLFALGGTQLEARLQASTLAHDLPDRLRGYQLTQDAIAANPWLGYGLGNFDSAFRMFRDASIGGWLHHAHNDYLEMVLDLGLPVALIWAVALALVIGRCGRGVLTRQRDAIYPALGVAASVQVGAHALVDFSLQIPAVAVTYAVLMGLGAAQSVSSRATG